MRKTKIKQISLAVCLAFMPFAVYSAGLGKLNVNSGLGEPLSAEIELLSVAPDELASLVAAIASEDAYAAQGITRLSIHNNIKVEIAKNADGSPILKLRSNQPISDPYLDMLIQVDWATGRLQREYTVLLDPPGYKQVVDNSATIAVKLPTVAYSDTVPQTNASSANRMFTAQPNVKKQKKPYRKIIDAPVQEKKLADIANEQDVTTRRGDTLSSVARNLQVEGVSLDQMLVGLYQNNKDAFLSGNMNRLKVGQIIKVPSKESLTSINVQQAKQSVKVHSTDWNAYRNTLADAAAKAPVVAEAEQKQTGSGKIATAEDRAAPAKVGPQDVVKLSAGEKGVVVKGGIDTVQATNAKIVALQEEAIAREKSLKETQKRTAILEKQIQDMQKLLAFKSQSMTQLQKNAETVAKAPEVRPADAKATVVEEVVKTKETPSIEAASVVEDKPIEILPVVVPEVKKTETLPVVKTRVKTQPEPLPEAGFFDGIINSVDILALSGAAGVALLGAGWMFLRNKRRKDLDSFERGILTSGGLRANTVFGNTTGNASTSDTSFLTDFSQNADGSMIDTNDVDPIAEAEVYMAYGRDAQAEEILKDAISKEPKRYELHLKLLEMYAGRKDHSAFEAIAGELYTTLGANDQTWAKVAELGAVLEPENPLYNLSKVVTLAALVAPIVEISEITTAAVPIDHGLDFSVDGEPLATAEDKNSAVMESFSEATSIDQGMSFDLGSVNTDSESLNQATTKSVLEEKFDENAISFEVIDANQAIEDNVFSDVFTSTSDTDNTMNFELGDFTEPKPETSDSAEFSAELPAFDTTMLSNSDFYAKPIDISIDSEATTELTDFDMDFMMPDDAVKNSIEEPVALEEPIALATNAIDDISFDLDFALDDTLASANNEGAAESVDKTVDFDNEISFDLPKIEEPSISAGNAFQINNFEANTFDLSSISLDLGDAEVEDFATTPLPLAYTENESPDVSIKLDLVAAYIDMDDKEGARELLEEVMKEGGANQQSRARQLLDSLV